MSVRSSAGWIIADIKKGAATSISVIFCQPITGSDGYLVLYSGERQISCTQPTAGNGDFVKTISATVEYDYDQYITKDITVKHIG